MTVSDGIRDLVRRRFSAVDAMDIDGLLGLMTEDHRLIFGGREPVVGKNDAADQINAFWREISGLRHNVERISVDGDLIFVESLIDYHRHDGTTVEVSCCDVFEVRGGLISETRAYLDQSAIWRGSE